MGTNSENTDQIDGFNELEVAYQWYLQTKNALDRVGLNGLKVMRKALHKGHPGALITKYVMSVPERIPGKLESDKFDITELVIDIPADNVVYTVKDLIEEIKSEKLFDEVDDEIISLLGDNSFKNDQALCERIYFFKKSLPFIDITTEANRLLIHKDYDVIQALLVAKKLPKLVGPLLEKPYSAVMLRLKNEVGKKIAGISVSRGEDDELRLRIGEIEVEKTYGVGGGIVFSNNPEFEK